MKSYKEFLNEEMNENGIYTKPGEALITSDKTELTPDHQFTILDILSYRLGYGKKKTYKKKNEKIELPVSFDNVTMYCTANDKTILPGALSGKYTLPDIQKAVIEYFKKNEPEIVARGYLVKYSK